jgi:hypothetical protein
MDGKQCEFKRHPDCGKFCSKHAVRTFGPTGTESSLNKNL